MLFRSALADIAGREKLPYHFVDRPGMVAFDTRDGIKTPVEISAEILKALKARAEAALEDLAELFRALMQDNRRLL